MKITITGRKVNLRDSFKERVTKKLAKFERFFGDEAEANVTVTVEKNRQTVEISIKSKDYIYRVEETCETMDESLDIAVGRLLGQIRKNKSKLEKHLRKNNLNNFEFPEYEEDEEEQADDDREFQIIRTKKFPVSKMNIDEAILQMNMLDHEFFMFRNDFTEEINVVYKRKDGNYGLLEPEK